MANHTQPECDLTLKPESGKCELALRVYNPLDRGARLSFATGQKYDYIIKNAEGEEIWQWSSGKAFIQSLQQMYIQPHTEITFSEVWQYIDRAGNPVKPGTYLARGILTTTPDPVKTEWVKADIPAEYIVERPSIRGRVTTILDKLYLLGEDGICYLVENPTGDISQLQNRQIEVTSYKIKPIPGTQDKKISIEEYRYLDAD